MTNKYLIIFKQISVSFSSSYISLPPAKWLYDYLNWKMHSIYGKMKYAIKRTVWMVAIAITTSRLSTYQFNVKNKWKNGLAFWPFFLVFTLWRQIWWKVCWEYSFVPFSISFDTSNIFQTCQMPHSVPNERESSPKIISKLWIHLHQVWHYSVLIFFDYNSSMNEL